MCKTIIPQHIKDCPLCYVADEELCVEFCSQHWKEIKELNFQKSSPISIKKIPLTQDYFALVDEKDFDWLSKFKWQVFKRHDKKCFYAVSRGGIRMHRIIMDCPTDMIIDHINGNGLDNRRSNLRIGTQSLNCVNRKNTPGNYLRGCRKKKNKWQSYIKIHGKQFSLGYFDTQEQAHKVYLEKALKEYGDWMPLPKPPKEA